MKLTNDQAKIDLVAKLVKDGAIDFIEAMKLLEVETEFVHQPWTIIDPVTPWNPTPWATNPTICRAGPQTGITVTYDPFGGNCTIDASTPVAFTGTAN